MAIRKIQLVEASKDGQGNLRAELYSLASRDRYQDVTATTATLTSGYRIEAVYDSSKFADVAQVRQACNALGQILVERYGTRSKSLEWHFGSAGSDSTRTRSGSVTAGIAMEVLIDENQFATADALNTALRSIS